jgi:hypothetical protein
MYKETISKIINAVVDQPLLGSIFIADFAVLALHKPPFIFSVIMLGGLGAMCMYFGQKLALFNLSAAEPTEKTEQAD